MPARSSFHSALETRKTDITLYFKKYARIMGLLSVTKSNIRSQQLLNGAASWPKIFHGLQLHTGWPLYKYHSLEVELPLCAVRVKHLTLLRTKVGQEEVLPLT